MAKAQDPFALWTEKANSRDQSSEDDTYDDPMLIFQMPKDVLFISLKIRQLVFFSCS